MFWFVTAARFAVFPAFQFFSSPAKHISDITLKCLRLDVLQTLKLHDA